ncbi:MAG: FAD-dependent oxidoreductase [Firmicutes bacterium]|nr:FAD-dependent oxidoreductase [Bacillota bacterium]
MRKENVDILIIGGGPAGLTAGVYAARSGSKTIIIEDKICGGQILQTGKPVVNMPGIVSISGVDLSEALATQAEESGATIVYDEITQIKFSKKKCGTHKISTSDTEFSAKAVIIATGAEPRKVGAINEEKFDGRGIHYCGLCDGAFYKDKDIVVVGGGNSAVEEVIYLATLCSGVIIVNATENFNAHSTTVEKLGSLKNIKGIYHNHTVEKFNGDKKIESLDIKGTNGKQTTIKCEGVFVAIGRAPSTKILGDAIKLDNSGYIIADNQMRTNIHGVFVAGDVRVKDVRQLVTACSDGAIAATSASAYIKE